VDLRGNAGGSLPEGIAFAGLWYEEGAQLLTLHREEDGPAVASVKNLAERELQSPVVAVIDGRTASTAEVVAGLIGALPNGFLVGQKTAGDPVARVDIIAGDPPCSMEMRLTIQLQGRAVYHNGIEPDFPIKPGANFQARFHEQSLRILNTPLGDKL
jgi:carboxyl-terminal processing protease